MSPLGLRPYELRVESLKDRCDGLEIGWALLRGDLAQLLNHGLHVGTSDHEDPRRIGARVGKGVLRTPGHGHEGAYCLALALPSADELDRTLEDEPRLI